MLHHHVIKQGATFEMSGIAPDRQAFLGMARRLNPTAGWQRLIDHRFHFICDLVKDQVLVVWVCEGNLYQNVLGPDQAEALFNTLERTGFTVSRLD